MQLSDTFVHNETLLKCILQERTTRRAGYLPVRVLGNKTIVTNGDQTDTIYELMDKQQTFEQALRTREFEPDAPNYTPRISGIMHIENGKFNYAMSILKSNNGDPSSCNRYTFAYENPKAGEAHFIHTYMGDQPQTAVDSVLCAFEEPVAPPIPSRPVLPPSKMMMSPGSEVSLCTARLGAAPMTAPISIRFAT